MRRLVAYAAVLAALLAVVRAPAVAWAAERVPLSDVFADPRAFDGKAVTVRGEVIGEVVRANGALWLQLNDDPYAARSIAEGGRARGQNVAIGVVVSDDQASKLRFFGDYDTKGDVVVIVGRFNAVCERHGGEADIHATSLEVVRRGYPIEHGVSVPLAAAAGGALALATVLLLVRRHAMSHPGFRRKGI